MRRADSVAEVRRAEAALMAQVPDGTLMQRAAFGLATTCARLLGRPAGSRVVVLVGSGDNGGDALFAGALLARRGALVDAMLLAPSAHRGGVEALRAAGGRIVSAVDPSSSQLTDLRRLVARADLVMDGIVGIGGSPGLREPAETLVRAAEDSSAVVVAVDLPSGIDVNTGETPASHVQADITVTFGTHKIGLITDPGATAAGSVELVDIGLGPFLPDPPTVTVLTDTDVAELVPPPGPQDHKYSRGVVAVRAGSAAFAGAAVLAVGGAVRGGAGMVRFSGDPAVADLVRSRWPTAVVAEGRTDAVAVGPGLGEASQRGVSEALSSAVPCVLDADALRVLPDRIQSPALLTPHAGELARMLDTTSAAVAAAPLRSAVEAAERWRATVLLKGRTTVVAAPDGRVRVNPTGTSWLATAGSGDVLTGLAGALLASGLDPFDAGSAAAYLHGIAGSLAAGRTGVPIAADLLDTLGDARRIVAAPPSD